MKKNPIGYIILCLIILVIGVFIGRFTANIPKSSTDKGKETPHISITPHQIKTQTPSPTQIKNIESIDRTYRYPEAINEKEYEFLSMERQKYILDQGEGAFHKSRLDEAYKVLNDISPLIKEGDCIADIGAGNGFYTFILSQMVGRKGRVYAIDTDITTLLYQIYLRKKTALKHGPKLNLYYDNISIIFSDNDNLTLPPDSIDFAFMSNVHIFHFDPREVVNKGPSPILKSPEKAQGEIVDKSPSPISKSPEMGQEELLESIHKMQGKFIRNIYTTFKKGGKFAVLEDMQCTGTKLRLDKKRVIKLLEKGGFKLYEDSDAVPGSHFLIFEKP